MPMPDVDSRPRLGPSYTQETGETTFTVFAPDADRIVLEIYDKALEGEAVRSEPMTRVAQGRWTLRTQDAGPGTLYGFRCWGANWRYDPAWRPGTATGFVSDMDPRGNRFNPNKVLLDPYAREISHTQYDGGIVRAGQDVGVFRSGASDYHGRPGREADTGPWAPKSIVVSDITPVGARPDLPAKDSAVYEVSIPQLTGHPSSSHLTEFLRGIPGFGDGSGVADVPDELRGTYAGAARMAPYLKALGFTVVELLPVHQSSGGEALPNAWGYQTLGFFAPHRAYAHDRSPGGPTREFTEMITAFHEAGLEVYLDVVYNHTGEGTHPPDDITGTSFVSMGGFACADYYVPSPSQGLETGATGVDNQVNYGSSYAKNLLMDSLAYWADVMNVDGFRFDLAPVLGQATYESDRGDADRERRFSAAHPLLLAIEQFARARGIEVIAEPWTAGWGNQVGHFPAGWSEWNDHYRNAVRRYLRGDGNCSDFITMVAGWHDAFADQGGPQRSVDFVTAHDGFTMMDLVSYATKINDGPPPFGPSDGGSDDNISWDSGGDHALRRQRLRNFWAVLFLSRGVPMIVGGDEMGRTQNGNNNPYNLEGVALRTNYAMAASATPTRLPADPTAPAPGPAYHDNFGHAPVEGVNPVFRFAAYVARLRRGHPGLRQVDYGELIDGRDDVAYVFSAPDGDQVGVDPGARAVRWWVDCGSTGADDLLILVNMAASSTRFAVPPVAGHQWRRIIDTGAWFEPENNCWEVADAAVIADQYDVAPMAVVVLRQGTA